MAYSKYEALHYVIINGFNLKTTTPIQLFIYAIFIH